MAIEIVDIQNYYALKDAGTHADIDGRKVQGAGIAQLINLGDSTYELQFKRFSQDTGLELEDVYHVPVLLDDLNNMLTDYTGKIDLVNNFISEVEAL